MRSSDVLHGIKANQTSSFTNTLRSTQFSYQTGGANLLKSEQLSATPPAGSALLPFTLNTYYDLDMFGNRIATYSCSSDISEALCKDPANAGNPMRMHPVDSSGPTASVRRYSRVSFDSQGRFQTSSRQPYFDPAVATREWTERPAMTVIGRDEFGDTIQVDDANGVTTDSRRGALGRDYAAEVETGVGTTALSVTTYRWCAGQAPAGQPSVSWPVGAVFRQQNISSGAPAKWSYHDLLGRPVLAVSQSFNVDVTNKDLSASCTGYDAYARTIKTSEPFFLSGVAVNGAPDFSSQNDPCANPAFSSTQSFDVLGRPRIAVAADGGTTTMTYPVVSVIVNGAEEVRARIRKSAPPTPGNPSRIWTETKNAAGETLAADDPNGLVMAHSYDPAGNLSQITRQLSGQSVVSTTLLHDSLGRKIEQSDPDMGLWRYEYNAAGEVIRQIDAKNQRIENDYDAQGRVWRRRALGFAMSPTDRVFSNGFEDGGATQTVITDTFQFDTASFGLGLLHWDQRTESGLMNIQRTLSYDSLARVASKVTRIEMVDHTETIFYDSIGRAFKSFTQFTEPGVNFDYSEGVETSYNPRGFVDKICKNTQPDNSASQCSSSQVYYQVFEHDARGNVTSDRRHNNVQLSSTRAFDPATGRPDLIRAGINGSLQDWNVDFDQVGNLIKRRDLRRGNQEEVLDYDALDRLKRVRLNGVETMALTYDGLGNLCNKSLSGSGNVYQYGAGSGCGNPNPVGSAHQLKSAYGLNYSYDANGDLISRHVGGSNGDLGIDYDAHRKARELLKATATTVIASSNFQYGPDNARYKRIDRISAGAISRTVRYAGTIEREEFPDGNRRIRHNIGGFLLLNREFRMTNPNPNVPVLLHNYVFTDHLGSTDIIAAANGDIVQEMAFDAHGSRRLPFNWTGSDTAFVPATTLRGYTGHEHIDDLGLIHMNARIYDPKLGRFLQADSEVEPDATQGLNRYTYVLNNPLSLTDPSGHRSSFAQTVLSVASIIVSVVLPQFGPLIQALGRFGAAVFSGFVAGSLSGGLQGGVWGAFSAGVFFGIGSHFQGLQGQNFMGPLRPDDIGLGALTAGQKVAKVLAHGIAGGAINTMRGGRFGHGFISAGVTEAFSPTLAGMNDFAQVASGAAIGGSVSYLTGGKFGNGAATAAFQIAFNHLPSKAQLLRATTTVIREESLANESFDDFVSRVGLAVTRLTDAHGVEYAALFGSKLVGDADGASVSFSALIQTQSASMRSTTVRGMSGYKTMKLNNRRVTMHAHPPINSRTTKGDRIFDRKIAVGRAMSHNQFRPSDTDRELPFGFLATPNEVLLWHNQRTYDLGPYDLEN